jgi:hypothetical protein
MIGGVHGIFRKPAQTIQSPSADAKCTSFGSAGAVSYHPPVRHPALRRDIVSEPADRMLLLVTINNPARFPPDGVTTLDLV